jgi:hypothetical protein
MSRSHLRPGRFMLFIAVRVYVLTGNRTRDLPSCSTVPQPTALPRAPVHDEVGLKKRKPFF